MSIQSINPTTGKVIKRFKSHTSKQIDSAIERAYRAFQRWRLLPLPKRGERIAAAAQILRERKQHYATLMTLEMGKPIRQSLAEVDKCAWVCDYFAQMAETFLRDEVVQTEAQKSYVHFEPLGVVFAIMPWNFPFWQVFRFAAPALMAGNVAILKHASNVPQCALAIEQVLLKAGCPKGVFTTLLIEPNAVKTIVTDERIAGVTLTGSDGAGRHVAEIAGRSLKKTVLELGGADPFIVLDGADLPHCSSMAAQSRTINSGQSCIAAKRFIVQKGVAEEFTDLLVKNMRALRVGDPRQEATQVGPLARKDLLETVHRQVQQSVRKGARLLTGGKSSEGKGFFYEPTVLARVKSGMPAFDEEVFGPVASVIVAKDEEDAIKLANDSRFGLGASVWSRDLSKAESLAQRLEAGNVFINDFVKSDPRLPFGGVKASGYGRELGSYGIKEFTNIKTISIR